MKKKIKYIFLVIIAIVFACFLTYFLVIHNLNEGKKDTARKIADMKTEQTTESTEEPTSEIETLSIPDEYYANEYIDETMVIDPDFQAEGADFYEVDEQLPYYHVEVENLNVMYEQYDDGTNCLNLKYYLERYFNYFTKNYDQRYVVNLLEGTCVNGDYIMTFDAISDVYPDVIIHIEYDKLNKAFGISSTLGDLSLEKLREINKEKREQEEETYILDQTTEYDFSEFVAPVDFE